MAQWWSRSPPTNMARVQILAPLSQVGWVCCWFSSLLREFFSGFSGFPPSSKINISKFQFDREFEGLGFVSRKLKLLNRFYPTQASCIDVFRQQKKQTKSGQCHPGYKGQKYEKRKWEKCLATILPEVDNASKAAYNLIKHFKTSCERCLVTWQRGLVCVKNSLLFDLINISLLFVSMESFYFF